MTTLRRLIPALAALAAIVIALAWCSPRDVWIAGTATVTGIFLVVIGASLWALADMLGRR